MSKVANAVKGRLDLPNTPEVKRTYYFQDASAENIDLESEPKVLTSVAKFVIR